MGREGDNFQSPEDQEARCHAMAEALGVEVYPEPFTDLEQSGGKMSRPEFDRMMRAVADGTLGGVIVSKLNRFARNTRGCLDAIEAIEAAGGTFISVEPQVDTSSPTGRFMLTVFAALAEMERDQARDGWRAARRNAITGERPVAVTKPPLGYRRVVGENGQRLGFEPDPEAAPVIREAFELRAKGGSWSQVTALIKERTGKARPVKSISKMLENRVYLGELRSGAAVNTHAHEPLVDDALYRRV
jgi:DNA invertase Pin-like site-specific DNA recombinase